MKILRIVCIIILLTFCILLIKVIYFRINLPYDENGRYFDENNGVVYHLESNIYFICLLILTVIAIIFIPKIINGIKERLLLWTGRCDLLMTPRKSDVRCCCIYPQYGKIYLNTE